MPWYSIVDPLPDGRHQLIARIKCADDARAADDLSADAFPGAEVWYGERLVVALAPAGSWSHIVHNGLVIRCFIALVACLSLVLSGCSTQSQRIGADDGSDVCHQQRVALDSTGDFFTEDIVKGAAVGAIGGALIGGLIGGNARGAAFGALAGGMAGAASGYWTARQKQATDQASLYQTVYGDIERDNISIGRTQVAFDQLVDCRRAEAARVRMGLRTGRLTPDQAQIAMAAVRERSDRDLRIAQSISTNIQSRSSDFAFANEQMNPGAAASASSAPVRGAPARVAQPGTPAGQVQTATLTNLSKRDQFSQSIARVQADRSAFELS